DAVAAVADEAAVGGRPGAGARVAVRRGDLAVTDRQHRAVDGPHAVGAGTRADRRPAVDRQVEQRRTAGRAVREHTRAVAGHRRGPRPAAERRVVATTDGHPARHGEAPVAAAGHLHDALAGRVGPRHALADRGARGGELTARAAVVPAGGL